MVRGFSYVAKEKETQKKLMGELCLVKCLVMAVGGGQTSSQVPDGGGTLWSISGVSLRCPPS